MRRLFCVSAITTKPQCLSSSVPPGTRVSLSAPSVPSGASVHDRHVSISCRRGLTKIAVESGRVGSVSPQCCTARKSQELPVTKAPFSLTAPVHRGLGSTGRSLAPEPDQGPTIAENVGDPEAEGKGKGSIMRAPTQQ